MPLTLDELHPYQSLLLARTRTGKPPAKGFLESALNDIETILGLDDAKGSRSVQSRLPSTRTRGLTIAGLHYVQERVASWTSDKAIVDRLNHLVLVMFRGPLVAIHLSEANWKSGVTNGFETASCAGLSTLEVIPSGTLNAAFVAGDAKTLWLSGTHRQARWKADNKVLSGVDLRDALDPIEDQTFHFTAARCRTALEPGSSVTTGVTPRRSQVWIGTSRQWNEFLDNTGRVLALIESTATPEDAPLPIVAVPTAELAGVADPYDIAILPVELLEDREIDPASQQLHEALAQQVTFEVIRTAGPNATAEVFLDGRTIGQMEFTLDASKRGKVQLSVSGKSADAAMQQDFEKLLKFCNGRGHIKIWFQSGHTFASDSIFRVRFRDIPFQLDFADFHGFDVRKEKPATGVPIGDDDSLFCWVLKQWAPGRAKGHTAYKQWLGCDDGAHEKADFVCLELIDGRPHLSLIHVKGVHGVSKAQRAISVSNYEVVLGQAVKNIRWLDRLASQGHKTLDERFAGAIKHAWRNGKPISPDVFRKALADNLQPPYQTAVIVLQPQATDTAVARAAKKDDLNLLRLRQLYTLLNQGKAAAANVGASFHVIGERLSASKAATV